MGQICAPGVIGIQRMFALAARSAPTRAAEKPPLVGNFKLIQDITNADSSQEKTYGLYYDEGISDSFTITIKYEVPNSYRRDIPLTEVKTAYMTLNVKSSKNAALAGALAAHLLEKDPGLRGSDLKEIKSLSGVDDEDNKGFASIASRSYAEYMNKGNLARPTAALKGEVYKVSVPSKVFDDATRGAVQGDPSWGYDSGPGVTAHIRDS